MLENLKAFIQIHVSFFQGEVDYYEFSKFVRKKENVIIQVSALLIFAITMLVIYDFPIYMIVISIIVIMLGVISQLNAYTYKKQMFNSFVMGISIFIVSIIVLYVSVVYFGFMN